MKLTFIEKALGSTLFSGYIPFASGTFSSVVAFAFYWIPGFEKPVVIFPLILLFTIAGVFIGNRFEQLYGKDPSQCTIDETVGMWISLLFLPKQIIITVIAFLLWRLLDIIKPFPARQAEKLPGGIGIIADDIISAIYTSIIMNLIVLKFF
ncbi:MAG: phosphatidylglycerophosphatase A [Ignavibacteria bacterium CG_4_8_14_3_um_filter_37_9]|nr:phosphatidylglycerophosphatase A [Ignavibacteria bacterium]OIO14071.1 MAG: phosphatidylglycerophosphatase A [Ignavibacteria bacterium CG1_02_37_35]PIP77283.1 MAG: phosphatidylglycerophosphatase A [Ignavibacteria bacterium CG22_combo_CG10-13_8_21_14_all_37_15]PIW99016.1 MAG: phosphatidylglycerophosphatase A [Ignavibacteria bacterium CG_4_8_14_3_um_filter_37_9]PIX95055.1 MAG: phosphatidylglycerophosphatase A [Ignavibacteria bacterium CG_4_10_14_3_um_filter_37_18]PJC58766.1 MAG: phosphatidylgl